MPGVAASWRLTRRVASIMIGKKRRHRRCERVVTATGRSSRCFHPDRTRCRSHCARIAAVDAERLRSVPVFAALSDLDRARLARWATEIDVAEGEELAREGKIAYEFFVVEEGTAAVTQNGERIAELRPGDHFGEIGLLETGRRTATVTATSPMKLLAIYGPPFRQLERELPELARQIRASVSERLARG